jgi:hypothetical protein
MGISAWWNERMRRVGSAQRTPETDNDQRAIARLAPEVWGMNFVAGAAYVLDKVMIFQESCTPAQAKIFTSRLSESRRLWEAQELTMPYWGNLAVLRTLQGEIAAQAIRPTAAESQTFWGDGY